MNLKMVINALDIQTIAPYDDALFRQAVGRVAGHPLADKIFKAFSSATPSELIRKKFLALKSVEEFQRELIDVFLRQLEKETTGGITLAGTQNIKKGLCYVFISNHRDIILDSALLTDMLFREGFRTPQICLGDNLLEDALMSDLVKMNKGITVKRGLPLRELLYWSKVLSKYIHSSVSAKIDSVWIAQSEGRSKDGADNTHPGVLKMLALSGEFDLIENLRLLHIVPVAVSYEFDSSDVQKAAEVFEKTHNPLYKKKSGDDLAAIVRGLTEPKGRIHIEIGVEIEDILSGAQKENTKSLQVSLIAAGLDRRIRSQYKNFPSNYVASDLLKESNQYERFYSVAERKMYIERLDARLATLEELEMSGPHGAYRLEIKKLVLQMYARTVDGAQSDMSKCSRPF